LRTLDSYVVRTVSVTMLLAVLGLLGILSIFTFLEQIEAMANDYDVIAVLRFCLYSLPRLFYDVIPYSAMIGCLAGLGLLANSSELVVMRAAGVSTWAISWSALKPTLLLVIVAIVLGESVLPEIERTARNDRTRALSGENQITPAFGVWYREGDAYMHFDEVGSGVVGGVSQYIFDGNDQMSRSLFADRAVFHDAPGDEKYWLMENVIVTDFYPNHTESEHLASLVWHTKLKPNLLTTEILVQPDKMSIGALYARIEYMNGEGLNSDKFAIGFWQKVLQPLATVGLVLVAISFIFGPLRESTMGMRVVAGLIVGIMFRFIQGLLSPASLVFGFPPLIAILLPILLCFGVGFLLLRRAR
jgi:lipopolysaccharide export system permease protein